MRAYSTPGSGRRCGLRRDERQLISRELHDQVAQSIAAGLHGLELGEHYELTGQTGRARQKKTEAVAVFRLALELTRELAAAVRAGHRISLPPRAVAAGDQPVPPEDLVLVVLEALRNAVAHANAGTVTVRMSVRDGVVTTSVEDDGDGIPDGRMGLPQSLGICSMTERAALLGGTCRISSGPAGGTTVVVTVPLSGQR
jgi:signal transduction histidine kinase